MPDTQNTGLYLYSDYCTGVIRALAQNGASCSSTELPIDTGYGAASFGEDESGNLHFVRIPEGRVYRFTTDSIFRDGFQ